MLKWPKLCFRFLSKIIVDVDERLEYIIVIQMIYSTVTDDICGNDHMGAVLIIESGRLGRDKEGFITGLISFYFLRRV